VAHVTRRTLGLAGGERGANRKKEGIESEGVVTCGRREKTRSLHSTKKGTNRKVDSQRHTSQLCALWGIGKPVSKEERVLSKEKSAGTRRGGQLANQPL